MMQVAGRRNSYRRTGFSLLELLVVLTILAILTAIVVPRVGLQGVEAKKHVCHQYKADLNSALELYRFNTGQLPSDLQDLHSDQYYPESIPKCPVDNQDYDFDAITGRIIGHAH